MGNHGQPWPASPFPSRAVLQHAPLPCFSQTGFQYLSNILSSSCYSCLLCSWPVPHTPVLGLPSDLNSVITSLGKFPRPPAHGPFPLLSFTGVIRVKSDIYLYASLTHLDSIIRADIMLLLSAQCLIQRLEQRRHLINIH